MKRQDKLKLEQYSKRLEMVSSSVNINPFETPAQKREAIERAKKDYAFFVQRYFPHFATASVPQFHIDFANKVAKNPTFKGFAQWGRALAKSVVNDVILPLWIWLREGSIYLVTIGSSGDRANQLLEDIRVELEANPQIIADFGIQHNIGNWEEGMFVTKDGRFIGQALGMGQSVRGLRVKSKRPTHIICDDIETKEINQNPARQEKTVKWIERDLIPTMDGDTRRFIQANNRFAPRMIQTILQEKHPKWIVHEVNAYDPVSYKPIWDKYPDDYFKTIEEEIGTLAAQSEYNNKPHIEGTIFTQSDIQYAPIPKLNQFKIIYGYWDVAYAGSGTSDYNSVVVQGLKDNNFWVIDVFNKQSKMHQPLAWMCQFQSNLPETVVVHWVFEAQFWNDAVESTIRQVEQQFNCRLNIIKINNPKVNKYDRILMLQPYYQNNRIYYNDKLKHNNDAQVGIAQLFAIEPGYKSHDDFPDAHQGGIAQLEKYCTNGKRDSEYRTGNYTRKRDW